MQARRTAQALTDLYDDALEESGLKVTQFALLRQIQRIEGQSLTALAKSTGLDRSTLGRNLRVMEREGLVRFAEARDARARSVVLTGDGRAALVRADPEWAAIQVRIKAALSPETLEMLRVLSLELDALRRDGRGL